MEFHKYIRPAAIGLVSLITFWLGSSIFTYFTYRADPEVRIMGLVDGGTYKGVAGCYLKGDNGYKVASVNFVLDGKPFSVDGASYVRSKKFQIPFDLDTLELSDGKHVLQIESLDSSYHANKKNDKIEFFVDNTPLKAALLKSDYSVLQGRTLHPKIQVNKHIKTAKVKLGSNLYDCFPDSENSTVYEAFIPVDCEDNPGEYLLSVEVEDKVGNVSKLSSTVQVKKVTFPKQKGFHVAPEKLDEEKEISMSDRILSEALKKWEEKSPEKKLWSGAFEVPTVIRRISTPFGEIRVTPEKGRYLHRAIDIINTPKSVVWSSQDGTVIIKERYLMTGNTVVVDHGLGVVTKYCHLDSFADIEVGDSIKKGEPVGKIGMSGYANGYHLHWELSVRGKSVDPIEWTKSVF